MEWNHLPEPGGLYQQNPAFLDRVYYIMAEKSKWDEQERKKKERESKNPKGGSPTRRPSMGGRGRR